MERMLVPNTPENGMTDADETSTSSMLSSILGAQSIDAPRHSDAVESRSQKEKPANNLQTVSEDLETLGLKPPTFMEAYRGPGKIADANDSPSVALPIDIPNAPHVDLSPTKKVFGSIEKLQKLSRNLESKMTVNTVDEGANASNKGLNQVLSALHEHDKTIRSLQSALNDIDVVAGRSAFLSLNSITRLAPSKSAVESNLSKLRNQTHVNDSKGKLDSNSNLVTKEWVQSEAELQIETFKKKYRIETPQSAPSSPLKANHSDTQKREEDSDIQDQIREEVEMQMERLETQAAESADRKIRDLFGEQMNAMKTLISSQLEGLIQAAVSKQIAALPKPAVPDLSKTIKSSIDSQEQNLKNDILEIIQSQISVALDNASEKLHQEQKQNFNSIRSQFVSASEIGTIEDRIAVIRSNLTRHIDSTTENLLGIESAIREVNMTVSENQQSCANQCTEFKALQDKVGELEDRVWVLDKLESRLQGSETSLKKAQENIQEDVSLANVFIKEFDNRLVSMESRLKQALDTNVSSQQILGALGPINDLKTRISSVESRFKEHADTLRIQTENLITQKVLDSGIASALPQMSHELLENQMPIEFDGFNKRLCDLEATIEKQHHATEIRFANLMKADIKQESNIQQTDLVNNVNKITAELPKINGEIRTLWAQMDEQKEKLKHQVSILHALELENAAKNQKADTVRMVDTSVQSALQGSPLFKDPEQKSSIMAQIQQKLQTLEEQVQRHQSELEHEKDALNTLHKEVETQGITSKNIVQNQLLATQLASQQMDTRISSLESKLVHQSPQTQDRLRNVAVNLDEESETTELSRKIKALDKMITDIDQRSRALKLRNDAELSQVPSTTATPAIYDIVSSIGKRLASVEAALENDIRSELLNLQLRIQKDETRFASTMESINSLKEQQLRYSFIQNEKISEPAQSSVLPENAPPLQEPIPRNQDQEEFMESLVTHHLARHLKDVESRLISKVDNEVLEELVKHLATRDELKKMAKKKMTAAVDSEAIRDLVEAKMFELQDHMYPETENRAPGNPQFDQSALKKDLKTYISKHLDRMEVSLSNRFEEKLKSNPQGLETGTKSDIKGWMKSYAQRLFDEKTVVLSDKYEQARIQMTSVLQKHIDSCQSKVLEQDETSLAEGEMDLVVRRLKREFDEKLFLVCSDLSACKSQFSNHFAQPFYRVGQWIWKSGQLKMGSAVPWNIQTLNTDSENFKWEQDQVNIRIAEPGLYEITFAFFTKCKPSIQLVVNGESVLSSINSPSYVVHHSSGYVMDGNGQMEVGTVTGLSLIDFLAIPAKSTLSLHYHGGKKQSLGHGFLGLKRL